MKAHRVPRIAPLGTFTFAKAPVNTPRHSSGTARGAVWGVSWKKEGKKVVGINVSGLLWKQNLKGNNVFRIKADYSKTVLAILDFILTSENTACVLVPHVWGDSGESDVLADQGIYDEIGWKYPGRIAALSGSYNQNEIKYIIGRCDFFIGSRMHACIAALSQCIPAIGLAYSHKFTGVLQSLGLEFLVADLRSLELPAILQCLQTAYENQEKIQNLLKQKIPEVKKSILEIFQENSLIKKEMTL